MAFSSRFLARFIPLLFLLSPVLVSCDRIHAWLHPNEGKIGFIDHNGRTVIQPQYQWIQGFKGGVAAVSVSKRLLTPEGATYGVDTQFGAINLQGVTVVPLQYDTTRAIGDGFIYANKEINGSEQQFLFDESGKNAWKGLDSEESPAIHLEFHGESHDGLVRYGLYRKNGDSEYGFVDKHGNLLFKTVYHKGGGYPPRQYEDQFGEGLIWAVDRRGSVLVNLEGQVTARFESAGVTLFKRMPFAGGFSAVATSLKKDKNSLDDGNWGYLDTRCEWVIPGIYDEAHDFSDGLACVRKGDLYGFVDAKGREAIPPQFVGADMYGFQDGFCAVQKVKDGLFFYIDYQGQKAFGRDFEEAYGFKEGLAAVRVKDKWGFIDKTGHFVIKPKYSSVGSFNSGLAAAVE